MLPHAQPPAAGGPPAAARRRLAWGLAPHRRLGLAVLAWFSGTLAAAVALVTWASYLFLYTPLKTRTSLATIVGALPGRAATRDRLGRRPPASSSPARSSSSPSCSSGRSPTSWPSPGSTARTTRGAGLPMLPVLDPEGRMTGRQAVANTLALLARQPHAGGGRPGRTRLPGGRDCCSALGFTARRRGAPRCRAPYAAARRLFLASLVYLHASLCVAAVGDRSRGCSAIRRSTI